MCICICFCKTSLPQINIYCAPQPAALVTYACITDLQLAALSLHNSAYHKLQLLVSSSYTHASKLKADASLTCLFTSLSTIASLFNSLYAATMLSLILSLYIMYDNFYCSAVNILTILQISPCTTLINSITACSPQ